MLILDNIISTCSDPGIGVVITVLKRILDIIQIVGPIIFIIALVINFARMMMDPENKKLVKNCINSLVGALVIFAIPIFINVVMGMLSTNYTLSSCWNNVVVTDTRSTYISPNGKKQKQIFISPSDYEKGDPKKTDEDGGTYNGEVIDGTAQRAGDIVWDPNDVTIKSNITSAQLVKVLNAHGGNAKNFIPYATGLVTAENKYSVNVFFLLGVEALESGWVTSSIAKSCNNLGGVCQSNAHPSNGCGSNSNCSFAYFSSVNEFVDYHASMLHKNYLTPGGSYYHGTSPSAVVTNYCPGCSSWPSSVVRIANDLFKYVSQVV